MAIKILSGENITGNITLHSPTNAPYIDFVENADTGDSKARITMDQIDTNNAKLFISTENSGTLTNAVVIDNSQNVGIGNFTNPSDGNLVVKKDGLNTGIPNSLTSASFSESGGQLKGLTIGYRTDETTAVIAARTATGDIAFMGYNGGWLETARFTNDNRLGIGTTSPTSKLSIFGSQAAIDITRGNSGDSKWEFSSDSTALYFSEMSTGTRAYMMAIKETTGNVGIGTTSPDNILHIETSNAGGPQIQLESTSGTASAAFINFDSTSLQLSTQRDMVDGDWYDTSKSWGGINIQGPASGSFITFHTAGASNTSPTERMRIVPAGAVGINNSSPDSFSGGGSTAASLVIGKGTSGVSPHITLWQGNSAQAAISFASANTGAGQYEGRIRYTRDTGVMDFRTNGVANVLVLNASGNVGIGTTSPNEKLQLAGNLNAYAPGGIDAGLFASTAAGSTTIAIRSSGVTHFNGGNVGIGTATPGRGLTIDKSNQYAALEIIKNNTTNQIVYLGTGSSAGTDDPILQMKHNGTENIRLYATGNSWINGGNVGIGTDSPGAKLVVSNSGALGYEIDPLNASGEVVSIFSYNRSTAAWKTTRYSSLDHRFEINGTTEAMRITSGGKVNIGQGTSITGFLNIEQSGNHIHLRNGAAASGKYWNFDVASQNRLYILNNGDTGVYITDGGTSWTANSDETLKENIKPLNNVLDKIKDYRCVEYNLKNVPNDKKIGFIAQDWVDDFAPIVNKEDDGLLGMKYTETIPVLLKAIQELKAEIELLKNK